MMETVQVWYLIVADIEELETLTPQARRQDPIRRARNGPMHCCRNYRVKSAQRWSRVSRSAHGMVAPTRELCKRITD